MPARAAASSDAGNVTVWGRISVSVVTVTVVGSGGTPRATLTGITVTHAVETADKGKHTLPASLIWSHNVLMMSQITHHME